MLKKITPQEKQKLIAFFSKLKPAVIMVSLIGSHGTGYQREDSDIDFAVLFKEKIGLLEEMKILKDLSEILNYENVDLVNLNKAPITLQFRAIEGNVFYEKDTRQVSDYMEKVFKIYGDYAPVLSNFDQEMLRGEVKVDEYRF